MRGDVCRLHPYIEYITRNTHPFFSLAGIGKVDYEKCARMRVSARAHPVYALGQQSMDESGLFSRISCCGRTEVFVRMFSHYALCAKETHEQNAHPASTKYVEQRRRKKMSLYRLYPENWNCSGAKLTTVNSRRSNQNKMERTGLKGCSRSAHAHKQQNVALQREK